MRVTTLIENSPSQTDPLLAAEWGLSLHVSFGGRSILFDMGGSDAFARNAERLGVDLAAVDAAVLSHHHFDHGGGLRRFFERNGAAMAYRGRRPDGECWFKGDAAATERYIGLDRTLLKDHAQRFAVIDEPTEILPGVHLFPQIRGTHSRPGGNRNLCLKHAGVFREDDFRHELVMAIRDNEGLVVFTGCSHNGVLNMLDTVTAAFYGVPVKAVVGGLHLVGASPPQILADSPAAVVAVGEALLAHPVGVTYTGHCTAAPAFESLKAVMGDRLQPMRTGSRIDL